MELYTWYLPIQCETELHELLGGFFYKKAKQSLKFLNNGVFIKGISFMNKIDNNFKCKKEKQIKNLVEFLW